MCPVRSHTPMPCVSRLLCPMCPLALCKLFLYIPLVPYILITKNYYSITEADFKAQYNNYKNSFTYCIDEKATEISNTFGT